MEFRILGSLEVADRGTALRLERRGDQKLLAVFLLSANRPVPLSWLVEAVWEDDPPATAVKQVLNGVSRLRGVLDGQRTGRLTKDLTGGYRLSVADGELDAWTFQSMVEQARSAARQDRLAEAVDMLRSALDLWRGPTLSGIDSQMVAARAAAWDERRLAALDTYYDHRLVLGQHHETTSELTALAAEYPLREKTIGQLMLSLYRSGRQSEALAAYRRVRALLADELGLDPGPELQRLHQSILSGDSGVTEPAPAAVVPAAGKAGPVTARNAPAVVPRQLPAAARQFVGRAEELKTMTALCEEAGGDGGAMMISAIQGTAGVGKTALAVYWAHQVASRFPDGQLYVNLRGFDPVGAPVTPAEAVRRFLDALNVPAGRLPADPGAQADLYRSLLSDKCMLVLLDNARDAAQVRPLLPGAPGCFVIVTSRSQLTSLVVTEGAQPLTLGLLDAGECRELLARKLGPERLDPEPQAVAELTGLCARLPLALSIAAARAAAQPALPVAALTSQLRNSRDRLNALNAGDAVTDIQAVFSWSYGNLADATARVFRLLGLHPGPDISPPATASLAGIPRDRARAALAELTRAHMLTEHVPGRFAFHDLLRAYAAEQAIATDSKAVRDAATRRVLGHYLHTAHRADLLLSERRDGIALPKPPQGVMPEQPADRAAALAWLQAESQVLLAAIAWAADAGSDAHVWQLSWAMASFLHSQGHWHDWKSTQGAALTAARRAGDLRAEALARRELGYACAQLGSFPEAHEHFGHALDLNRRLGDLVGQAHVYEAQGWAYQGEERVRESLRCAEHALQLYRQAGHDAGQSTMLSNIGWLRIVLGDYQEAIACCEEALPVLTTLHSDRGAAGCLDNLGYAHHHLGNHQQALACYAKALNIFRQVGDRYSQTAVLTHIGDCHQSTGDHQAAREAWQEALDTLDDLHHPDAGAIREKLAQIG